MRVKASEIEGDALDWSVAQVVQFPEIVYHKGKPVYEKAFDTAASPYHGERDRFFAGQYFQPSRNWEQGGPLTERTILKMEHQWEGESVWWRAWYTYEDYYQEGSTILIAAMRAIVANELGEEFDIPDQVAAELGIV
ncbi:phage protein NinX family protein [Vreelandella titanicae]|uniref:phage protein NinX family protein n=1 Tax=Vreelandella titanicae TaxID=664683 RepID=UPI003D049CBC|tara:strand:- start:1819 stop:2229 length:411 start_codon:yes stop_codon:yes gene_type:complete